MTCALGVPLFPSNDDNSTFLIIHRLEKFRAIYEPFHGYVCVVICIFGILTNLINVIVLTKRQMRTSINVLLTGIAICDMGTMLSYLIYIIHFVLTDQSCNPSLYSYAWILFLFSHIVFSIALHTTGLWLAVAMAFVRNMTLRKAMTGSKWLRAKNTWKICLSVYICVFILSIPSALGNSIMEYPSYFNDTCQTRSLAEWYEKEYYTYTIDIEESRCLAFAATLWLTGTLFKIIPCCFLAILIISLVWTIKKAERRRRALFQSNSINRARMREKGEARFSARTDRTSTMLVAVLGLFLLTELPQGAISILSGIYVGDMRQYVYPNVADVLDLLSLINSSVNFFLYCTMSSKYRQVFWQVVLPRKIYVRWFLKPKKLERDNFQPITTNQSQNNNITGRRITRPELMQLMQTDDITPDNIRRNSEQETTIVELYQTAKFEGTENRPRGISLLKRLQKKNTNMMEGDLRRRALANAALTAATPGLAVPGAEWVSEEEDEPECTPFKEQTGPQSKPRPCLISCSCLCKCACKSAQRSQCGREEGQIGNYGTGTPDLVPAIDTERRRSSLTAAMSILQLSSSGTRENAYVRI